jgi:hypothetical protein
MMTVRIVLLSGMLLAFPLRAQDAGITPSNVIPEFAKLRPGLVSEFPRVTASDGTDADYVEGKPLTAHSKAYPIEYTVLLRTQDMLNGQDAIQFTVEFHESTQKAATKFVEFRDFFAKHPQEIARKTPLLAKQGPGFQQYLCEQKGGPALAEEFYCQVDRICFSLHYRAERVDRALLLELGGSYRDYLLGLLGAAPSPGPVGEMRIWTNLSGKTIEAAIVHYDEAAGTLDLRRRDGQEFKGLAVNTFSRADLQYLASLKHGPNTPAAP